jgi:hypothetical protein
VDLENIASGFSRLKPLLQQPASGRYDMVSSTGARMTPDDDTLAVLREIRDDQRRQIERQAEALALQREQFELYKRQYDRAERINDRTEAFQSRQAGMFVFIRRLLFVVVPLLALLIALAFWPFVVNLWH